MNILINNYHHPSHMKRSYTWLMICISLVFVGCSSKALMNKTAGQQITVENDPLVLFKDSVQAVVKASIPSALVTEKTNYYLLPEFQYGEGALPLEDIKVDANSSERKDQPIEFTRTIVFPYQEGMDRGVLRVKGLLEEKESKKTYSTPYINLAEGIISTPKLVQVGQFAPGEAIPQVGAYMR